jgi:hypothetical protein
MRTLAIALVIIGGLMLAYQGISYTQNRNVIDIGPLQASVKERKTLTLSPVLGIVALGLGVVLIYRTRQPA